MSKQPKPRWNVELLAGDMAGRGWTVDDVATRARVSRRTVERFLSGSYQTTKTANKIAGAFGYQTPRRYLSHVETAA